MARFLKENTATRITVGPFLDVGDGFTPELALTVTGIHVTLCVDDAGVPTLALDVDATASGGANDMVHITNDNAGFYDLELAAANVNFTGRAILACIDDSEHLPVFHEFQIVRANVYDSLFIDSDNLNVQVAAIDANAITAASINADAITEAKIADNAIATEHIATGAITADSIAANAIGASEMATDAIGAAQMAADSIDASALATDAVTEIANGVWDTDATSRQTAGTFGQAIGDPGANTETMYDAVVTDAAGTNVAADIIVIEGQTDDIGVAGAGLTAINLPNQTMDITGDITGNLSGSIGSNTELGPAEVNAEVVDVLKTDTLTATPQQAPPTTPTFEEAVMVLYDAIVHGVDVTATLKAFKNNAGTVIWKKALSDDATTYAEAESASGPA